MSDHKKREQMLAEDDGYPPGLTKQIRFPRYKCLTCNEVIDYDDTGRASMTDIGPNCLTCPCGSDQLVECDRDWAMNQLKELRLALTVNPTDAPIWDKFIKQAEQNLEQVEDWISEQ